jgi:hypothetical protein
MQAHSRARFAVCKINYTLYEYTCAKLAYQETLFTMIGKVESTENLARGQCDNTFGFET